MTVATGLHGALLLARGRADGIQHIDPGREGALRSFWALALCLPGFLALQLADWADSGVPRAPAHAMGLELLAYVVGWLSFAVASRHLVAALGRGERWLLFLGVWNWCNVVQYLLLVAAAVPHLLGAPDWLGETASLVAVGWALWLEWYAARLTLDVGRLAAAGLVAFDLAIGAAISAVVGGLT